MICNRCNHQVPDDSEFCHVCGNKISKDAPHVTPVKKVPVEKETKVKKPMSKKAKKTIVFTSVSVVSLALIAVLVFFVIIPLSKYNHAQELLELGKYDLAYTAFSELGNYSDAEDKLLEVRYLQAVDYRKSGDYDVANKIFETLGDYRDSKALIHKHDYSVNESVAATCTSKGSETLVCTSCNHTKVNTIDVIAHNYTVTKETKATCNNAGEKSYTCSACNHSYTEKIAQKSHNWKSATCSVAKTCENCGKTEGSALGHSNDIICTRCGATTFKTLEYSGYGVGNVMNVDLPKGKYNFIITHSGQRNFFLDFNDRSIVIETGKVSYVHQYTSSGLNDGYFNITSADGYWTIKIVAVSN